MFESLQDRLGSILNGLTGRGALSEKDVSAALREVRRALLEADVALEVVRSFTDKVREKAVGADVLKSIKPGVPRVPTVEIMTFNPIVKKLVLEAEDHKLADAIRIGAEEGMQDFTMSLKQLIDDELIDRPTAFAVAPNQEHGGGVSRIHEAEDCIRSSNGLRRYRSLARGWLSR